MTKRPRSPRSKPLLLDNSRPLQSRPIRKRDKAQPALPLDPMPRRVEPALALLKQRPPAGDQWQWEIKWDGYRLAVHIEHSGVRIVTRGGYNWADRFPAIEAAARALGPATMILDGEGVVLDEQGRSDFNALQNSLGAVGRRSGNQAARNAIFYAFDLLYLDGHDLRSMEYRDRRHLLEETLLGSNGAIRLSEEVETDPAVLLDHACRLGLGGIVGKKRDSRYRSGRTGDWVKLKCVQTEAFFIVGYEPGRGFGGFASLLLAAYHGDELRYVGSVGTGFKERTAVALRTTMDKLPWRQKVPPVPYKGNRRVVWVQPTLIAEIEFGQRTPDNKLRHASYKGLREIQDNADVYRLEDEGI
ncbi:non-homologous end-joining DNA ligase (plasmid) [Rhizobium sp. CB3171]|uniref:non-homologous end-joining DNA ligase n=1 Tax=Rhizobium sp. CB3171 TaxID=3039157 RepID=UPI0024B0D5D8|nr:non-homologous end-joining DNA ligase [Rhizobium sp. CB3171]WFU07438.1 non-homologous end-joining DNA ligase [Rhizobium sp. CB3171]